jgi:hypothetical protein
VFGWKFKGNTRDRNNNLINTWDRNGGGWMDDWKRQNYLLTNVTLAALEIGFWLPNVFNFSSWRSGGGDSLSYVWTTATDPSSQRSYAGPQGWYGNERSQLRFVEDSLQKTVFGVKFAQSPLEVAMQFKVENFGAYFGAKFDMGAVNFGIDFQGEFDLTKPQATGNRVADDGNVAGRGAFAAGVGFNGGAFGADLSLGYSFYNGFSDSEIERNVLWPTIGIRPVVWYNVFPDTMQFKLGTGFYMVGPVDFVWSFVPEIFWNMKGNGAGGWGTGMALRYALTKDTYSFFSATFKWNM